MQDPATIVVSLLDRQEGLKVARSIVGIRNHNSLTEGWITVDMENW
jgi:hypothetical protein